MTSTLLSPLVISLPIGDRQTSFEFYRTGLADVPHISYGLSGQLPVLRVGGGREAE